MATKPANNFVHNLVRECIAHHDVTCGIVTFFFFSENFYKDKEQQAYMLFTKAFKSKLAAKLEILKQKQMHKSYSLNIIF